MGDRYTLADCEALLARIITETHDECPDTGRLIVHRESGVNRLRIVAVEPGSWQSDVSPACMTARELWLYLRGLSDGHRLIDEVRRHTEADISILRHQGRMPA